MATFSLITNLNGRGRVHLTLFRVSPCLVPVHATSVNPSWMQPQLLTVDAQGPSSKRSGQSRELLIHGALDARLPVRTAAASVGAEAIVRDGALGPESAARLAGFVLLQADRAINPCASGRDGRVHVAALLGGAAVRGCYLSRRWLGGRWLGGCCLGGRWLGDRCLDGGRLSGGGRLGGGGRRGGGRCFGPCRQRRSCRGFPCLGPASRPRDSRLAGGRRTGGLSSLRQSRRLGRRARRARRRRRRRRFWRRFWRRLQCWRLRRRWWSRLG